jgi:Tfp pilus assembly protein PilO
MRMRFGALGVGTLVLVLGLYMLGIKPSTTKLSEVKADVRTTQDEISALKVKLAELQELKRNEEQLRADVARLSKGLPSDAEVSSYIRQVQQIASDAEMQFLSITPGVPADGATPGLKSISLTVASEGSFFSVEDFISKMERLERAVRIVSFNLSGASPRLSLALSMNMFMQGPAPIAATPAPGASPVPADGTAIVPEAVPG